MKEKIFNLEEMNIAVRLHVSKKDYPKELKPNDAEFFIHVDNNEDMFNEDVINALDDAAGFVKAKFDKDPEGTRPYKFKIKKYGVYIRDEAKDPIELDFMYDVILALVDEIQADIEDTQVSEENDDNSEEDVSESNTEEDDHPVNYGSPQQKATEIHLDGLIQTDEPPRKKQDDNISKIKSQLNIPDISTSDDMPEIPFDEPEDVKKSSMKISKLSLPDSETKTDEEKGEEILSLLIGATDEGKKR